MAPNPFFGVVLHAIGGFAAGSFYIPFKMVRKWSWESYWLAASTLVVGYGDYVASVQK